MLYARALLLRNCGRFTHVRSDFGSQYHTHTFVTSEALYASLTREATWRHASRFVDLEADASKSASEDYFLCDYDVKSKPLWFTPGVFVDERFRLLPKQRSIVDWNDFNVVDEGYPGTGGGGRRYYCPTYGRIESVLPDHRLFTCALSPNRKELENFTLGQTFLLGKKRTMFQIVSLANIVPCSEDAEPSHIEGIRAPIQVKPFDATRFTEYEILAATARYLLLQGRSSDGEVACAIHFGSIPEFILLLPRFWFEQTKQLLGT